MSYAARKRLVTPRGAPPARQGHLCAHRSFGLPTLLRRSLFLSLSPPPIPNRTCPPISNTRPARSFPFDCIPYPDQPHLSRQPWPTPQEAPRRLRTPTTSPRRSSGPRRGSSASRLRIRYPSRLLASLIGLADRCSLLATLSSPHLRQPEPSDRPGVDRR